MTTLVQQWADVGPVQDFAADDALPRAESGVEPRAAIHRDRGREF